MASISRCSWQTAKGEKQTGHTVDWRDANGTRRRKQFSGVGALRAAKAYRNMVETDPDAATPEAGPAEAPAVITVKVACDTWIQDVKDRGRAKSTWSAGLGSRSTCRS